MKCKYEKQSSHRIVLQQYFHSCVHFHHNSDRFDLPALRICRYRIQCNHRGLILQDTRNLHCSLWIKTSLKNSTLSKNHHDPNSEILVCILHNAEIND